MNEKEKNLTPEIGGLFQELEAYEEKWKGKLTDNDWLALYLEDKAKILKSLVIWLARAGQNFSKRLSEAEAEKDLAVHALCESATDCRRLEELVVKLVSKNQELFGGGAIRGGQARLECATNPAEFKSKETFKETPEMLKKLRGL
ncbi:MAG: hypothetical protein NTY33_01990 [Candidatus Moranbacteria bacterium]|nr:hypothetical protein [Candidatus Moranbacteria bacterium]